MEHTHYQTLGVAVGASAEQIRGAYRLAVEAFRARLRDSPPPPEGAFDALRTAYQTLSDPEQRQRYDAALQAKAQAQAQDAASATADTPIARTRHPLAFTGDGTTYFRIWIVNLVLSVLTLGIYSAWAKVRREQFFHRNLQLDGAGFDYHGTPKAILKGRVVAVVVLGALSLAQEFEPLLYGLMSLALIPVVPWVMVRALRFRAAVTSYRGLRFGFDGSYRAALIIFVGYGLLTLLTLGLCFPLWYRAQRRFVQGHLRFGGTPFSIELPLWPVVRIFVLPFVLTAAVLGAIFVNGVFGLSGLDARQMQHAGALLGATLIGTGFAALLLFGPYVRLRLTNLVWNATRVGPHRIDSALPLGGYLVLVAGNTVLTVLTLGLFHPWAAVRVARFRAAHTALLAAGSLDDFVAGERSNLAAVGEELADLADFDLAL